MCQMPKKLRKRLISVLGETKSVSLIAQQSCDFSNYRRTTLIRLSYHQQC